VFFLCFSLGGFVLFCFFVGRFCSSFYFLCCPIMCLYVPNSVMWCLLRFPLKMMLGLWEGTCLIYIIYASLRVMSNTIVLCFVLFVFVLYTLCCQFSGLFLFFLSSSCIPYVANSLDCFCFVFLRLVCPMLPILWIVFVLFVFVLYILLY
jgi:hypothetical protein